MTTSGIWFYAANPKGEESRRAVASLTVLAGDSCRYESSPKSFPNGERPAGAAGWLVCLYLSEVR